MQLEKIEPLKTGGGVNITFWANGNISIHFIRGVLLFLGIAGWTYGLSIAPITTGTVITFTIPIFVLMFTLLQLRLSCMYMRGKPNRNCIYYCEKIEFAHFVEVYVLYEYCHK